MGLDGSSLFYRLIGPLIMLLTICALMPALRNWGGAKTTGISAGVMIGTVAIGLVVGSFEATARTPTPQTPTLGVLQ